MYLLDLILAIVKIIKYRKMFTIVLKSIKMDQKKSDSY